MRLALNSSLKFGIVKMTDKKSKIAEIILFVALVVFAGFFFFYKLGENHLIEYDEGIYGVVAQNILKTGDWITLTWQNGIPWYDKGPLYFWLTALSLKLLGNTALAIRLWSALFGFGSVMLVYLLGKKLFNEKVGLFSGFVLASTTGYLYYGRLGMLDVPTAFFVVASVYCLWRGRLGGLGGIGWNRERVWFLLAGASLALGFLLRGFVGLLGLVSFSVFSLFEVKRWPFKHLFFSFLLLAASFLLLAAPWHILMYLRHGDEFLQTYFGHQMFSRFAGAIEGKDAPRFWYVTVIRTQFRIWFVALLAAIPAAFLGMLGKLGGLGGLEGLEQERKALSLVLIWAGLTFAVFTVAGSKLIWYIIPIYPSLSLIVGWFFWRVGKSFARLGRLGEVGFMCLIGLTSLFYNVRMWSRIKTEDFTKDQAAAIEFKDRIDAEATFCCVDMGWSVCQFYAPKVKVFASTEETLLNQLKNECTLAVAGKEALARVGKEAGAVGCYGDVCLIKRAQGDKMEE